MKNTRHISYSENTTGAGSINSEFAIGYVINFYVLNQNAGATVRLLRDIIIGSLGDVRNRVSNLSKWGRKNDVSHNTAYELARKLENEGIIDIVRDENKIVFIELTPSLFKKLSNKYYGFVEGHSYEMEN